MWHVRLYQKLTVWSVILTNIPLHDLMLDIKYFFLPQNAKYIFDVYPVYNLDIQLLFEHAYDLPHENDAVVVRVDTGLCI